MPSTSSPPIRQEVRSAAARWLARRQGGALTSGEQQDFLRWLNAHEENRSAYEEAERLWEQLGGLEPLAGRQLAEARAYLADAGRKPARRRVLGFALAASLAAVAAWNAGWLDFPREQTYRTALGEHKTFTLADGSRLDLDTDSEITVRYSHRARELTLTRGQAAFAVAHGDARPFDVFAGQGRVRDVGTQFDVRRYDDRVAVTVLEGAVEVKGPSAAVRQLRQGERISFTPQGDFSPLETADANAVAAWREGRLVFHSRPLGEVLAELGRYHSASLTVTSSRLLNIKVSGVFPTDNLNLALNTITATLPVKLTRTGPQSWRLDGSTK